MRTKPRRIVVVGLGYVGLPLAVALASAHADDEVVGFDIDPNRIGELIRGEDRTREVDCETLKAAPLRFTTSDADCAGADMIIVTVPTPVDANNRPDLGPLLAASRRLAGWIDPAKRPTIVYESTVYPGATEEDCGPAIAATANLVRGRDFRLGYSPERINPGDKVHTVDKIVKIVAGEDDEVLDELAQLYGAVTEAGVFRAATIRTAEAAKAIENAQRDINIAFMNEVAQILSMTGTSVWDVLDAARTKWNFLPFEPGLVGGHCIGVDPYYLSYHAETLGHDPRMILSGRGINDGMGPWVADRLHARLGHQPSRILFMGMTFKEDVPDVRNSRAIDVIRRLEEHGHEVTVIDPLANPAEVAREYGVTLAGSPQSNYHCVFAAVGHQSFRAMSGEDIIALAAEGALIADLKGIWRSLDLPPHFRRWSL